MNKILFKIANLVSLVCYPRHIDKVRMTIHFTLQAATCISYILLFTPAMMLAYSIPRPANCTCLNASDCQCRSRRWNYNLFDVMPTAATDLNQTPRTYNVTQQTSKPRLLLLLPWGPTHMINGANRRTVTTRWGSAGCYDDENDAGPTIGWGEPSARDEMHVHYFTKSPWNHSAHRHHTHTHTARLNAGTMVEQLSELHP